VTALAGKVVLVTGVARGCGRVLAQAFAADRAKVVGCDTDVDGGRATAAAVRAAGGEMSFVEADVADDTAVQELVATTARTYGGLDCAVNNAGTEATGLIADSDGGGSIVNMSSVTSDITAVPANGLYAATKGGVNALTKAAAVEVAKDNISVNALAFAAIDIPGDMIWRFLDSQGIAPQQLVSMFPIGRMGRPEELVAAVRYLCSDEARYMTGTMLVLDGGYTAQ
jgi:NAD(P)-dependent dehydrogenase (short-subunit alcohol dehydrogenase family)